MTVEIHAPLMLRKTKAGPQNVQRWMNLGFSDLRRRFLTQTPSMQAFKNACRPLDLTMSREPARTGCQQMERALRQYRERPGAAVGLQLLLPQLRGRPAARCSIPMRQCSHAAGSRNRSAHLIPAGVSPFAPFAASAVSNTASDSGSEEHLEDSWHRLQAVGMILSAGILLPLSMSFVWPGFLAPAFGPGLKIIWPKLAAIWAWLRHCNCNKWQHLEDCAKSQLHEVGVSFRLWLRRMASGMFVNKIAKVMEESLLSPKQLRQLREVLDEYSDADKAYGNDKASSSRTRLLVERMEGHLSPEQLDQLQQGLDELFGTDMA